jgi:peptidoglycan/xylan/chitin deacetylase (PgdA/CDA1 family)
MRRRGSGLSGDATWTPQPAGGHTYTRPTLAEEAKLRRRLLHQPEPAARRAIKSVFYAGYTHGMRAIPRRLLAAARRQRVVVFCYHRVNDDMRDSLTVGVEQFDEQMDLLARMYPVVSIEDVVDGTFERDTARPAVAVTFDDGYRDNWQLAVPILARHRIPAAFFVSTGMIGTDRAFEHDLIRLGHALPTMDWENLARMQEMGFTIGAHTVTHINCARVDAETLRRELTDSRDTLRSRLGIERPIFAYPFGKRDDITPEGLAMVRELGYRGMLSAYGGCERGSDRSLRGAPHRHGLWRLALRVPRGRRGIQPVSRAKSSEPPLIAHVIYHLIMGGLENGLVNLVNRIPYDRYRHVIVCLAYHSEFRERIQRPDVDVLTLRIHERGARAVMADLYRLFRTLRPAVVHSRNISGLDSLLPAFLAGVPYRLHGEHGWELVDLGGENRKNQWNRRLHAPLVSRYIALSKHQERYLIDRVGIASRRIEQIYNGADVERFPPEALVRRTRESFHAERRSMRHRHGGTHAGGQGSPEPGGSVPPSSPIAP